MRIPELGVKRMSVLEEASIALRLAEKDMRDEEGRIGTRADVPQRNPSANVHKARHLC
jgi:hypothetical protein